MASRPHRGSAPLAGITEGVNRTGRRGSTGLLPAGLPAALSRRRGSAVLPSFALRRSSAPLEGDAGAGDLLETTVEKLVDKLALGAKCSDAEIDAVEPALLVEAVCRLVDRDLDAIDDYEVTSDYTPLVDTPMMGALRRILERYDAMVSSGERPWTKEETSALTTALNAVGVVVRMECRRVAAMPRPLEEALRLRFRVGPLATLPELVRKAVEDPGWDAVVERLRARVGGEEHVQGVVGRAERQHLLVLEHRRQRTAQPLPGLRIADDERAVRRREALRERGEAVLEEDGHH